MLRLENIIKNYQTGKTSFPALKGISLAFRKNEFVSILGPSGCGKTTLLNIIGGLDHYTTGDLVIEGKSTKEYKDRDWDLYRNHRIGFIFQSYNLIPHQNILENVELALTIAGYSKEEKHKKALKALSMVGLKKAWKKMPNQLSGGQCQRVAIARALVNEPDILLGDEPTGALDSKTSVQVMELIKKISKKKLVIMVTHNPPLAEQYSTRIISLLDGEVQKDTNPYKLSDEKQEKFKKVETIKVGNKSIVKADKAKMSFWDAFKLSAKNLISKKKRTAMVIAASSIGIVGVASVLAVSTGVRGFISNTQKDMLSSSPLTASETTFDLVNILKNVSTTLQKQAISESIRNGWIDIEYLTGTLINQAKQGVLISNDITLEYEQYIKEGKAKLPEIADVFYDYDFDISNNIYTSAEIIETGESVQPENNYVYSLSGLKNIYTALLGSIRTEPQVDFTPLANIAANFPSIMFQGLDNEKYISEQYDVLKGHFAKPVSGDDAGTESNPYQCVVVLNKRKKLVDLIVALSGMLSEEKFMKAIMQFISETPDEKVIESLSKILLDDVINKSFYYIPNGKEGQEGAYYRDSGATGYLPNVHPYEYNYRFEKTTDASGNLAFKKNHISGGGVIPVGKDSTDTTAKKIKVVGIIAPKEGRNYGSLSSGVYFLSDLSNKMMSDSGVAKETSEATDADSDLYRSMINPNKWFMSGTTESIVGLNAGKYETSVTVDLNGDKSDTEINYGLYYPLQFYGIEKFDENDKPVLFQIKTFATVGNKASIIPNLDADRKIVSHTISSTLTSRQLAGRKMKYVNSKYTFNKVPSGISVYSRDFQSKDVVKAYLDDWNSDKTIIVGQKPLTPKERTKIIVPDNLTIVINMINGLINTTTISLTIFASLSLVVSSVMIGIITYISVMERIKEIGVIRSLGGRKKDVSHLFNAETFILGTAAGLFGILITYVFELILDITIYATYKIPMIANLKWWTALIMVILSIVLTAVSGLIPSRSAAKKDPVTALRSE